MQIQDVPDYKVLHKIPKGGMTDLYVCQRKDEDKVVIRYLKESSRKNSAVRKAFRSGIDILGGFSHPGVIKLLSKGKGSKGAHYMVIPYHESENLRECILHKNPKLKEHSLTLIRKLADALAYVHNQGYIHMDLKPENVLIDEDLNLILIDFDLCRAHKGNKPVKLKILQGTPTYLAPETLRQQIVDERSEVFTYGVIAYEMLTMHKPFEANSVAEYKRAVGDPRVKPYPLHEYRQDVSRKVEEIVTKCLRKDPESRYPSMSLVCRDLQALL